MAVTGHKSKDGFRTYKISWREGSDILCNNFEKAKIAHDDKENRPPHIGVGSKPSGLNIAYCHITINH